MTNGLHHITAIASNPQTCYDFYAKTLGLRLVKKSINQDQVEAYHLFFGDKAGEPGMDLTFFTFSPVHNGTPGVGEVSRISLAIPENAIDFWQDRLESQDIKTTVIKNHFDHSRLRFQDPDGGRLELVATPSKQYQQAAGQIWTTPEVSKQNAIGYFHSASMTVTSLPTLAPILQTLGYQQASTIKQSHLYSLNTGTRAVHIELDEYQTKTSPPKEPVAFTTSPSKSTTYQNYNKPVTTLPP